MITKGFNKAQLRGKTDWLLELIASPEIRHRPCVFISHKREDKNESRKIAAYFQDAGIDYYLDEEDNILQYAASTKNPLAITESIKKGIRESTHMLVIISAKTYKSLWVPFEVGYGHATILDQENLQLDNNRIKLSILTLKDISKENLPDYLLVGYLIRGTKSLNEYISKIINKQEHALVNESRIISNSKSSHPLDNILDWQL